MGQEKPERTSWFSLPQVFRNLRFPRRGSRCVWFGKHLIDPETQEVVACCLLWGYGPVGAYACSEGMTELLFEKLPKPEREVLAERMACEVDDLAVRLRQESLAAGGEKESGQGGLHGDDDAGDGRWGA